MLLLLLACAAVDPLTGDDTADTGGSAGPTAPSPGDLVITEIMPDPLVVDGDFGEWFEVKSLAGGDRDLAGMTVTDDDATGFTVEGSLVLPAGGYLVFAPDADATANGGLPVDYAYDVADLKLGNEGDAVVLTFGNATLDLVAYDPDDGFPIEEGYAMSLSPSAQTPEANDDGARWCAAASVYGGGDRGTPGAPNDGCP